MRRYWQRPKCGDEVAYKEIAAFSVGSMGLKGYGSLMTNYIQMAAPVCSPAPSADQPDVHNDPLHHYKRRRRHKDSVREHVDRQYKDKKIQKIAMFERLQYMY